MSQIDPNLLNRLKEFVSVSELSKDGRLKLPAERALCEHFDMHRSSVRNVLSLLQSLGFIERKQGSGTFLKMPEPVFIQLYFELALKLNYISVDHLETAREMFEKEIVQAAAINHQPHELKRLELLCEKIVTSSDVLEGIQADYEFHELLAIMAKNPAVLIIFQGLSSVLKKVLHQRRILARQSKEAHKKTNETHIAIVAAVKTRDRELARQAMHDHFETWNQQTMRSFPKAEGADMVAE
ncbi:FadR/GntR family transcriptional regulator [Vreelandella aquamarina]|jgi:GntR family transcriptional repressor for pyruvate dehydrogenase complex|uniref:Transcriptional regulator, GntR family n=1 Tax=Vreelandella aquamarina TaxID=77097 RepID=A0A1N6CTD5_9GAMM|nr:MULTISPECIES: FCD domain-containing protein [Halomonas]SIN61726.1 transcriptional regulator, GntR family [Halomonas meridiana]SIN67387.1 transcriptional regulator, GntR family [Halomonas meridiana]SIN94677.1 transcriptional regulator, GntR family [Halomonas meridiana]HAO01680.1 FadR family transcriptional regulator [Halomonas sp.]|tara:strand:+ start:2663 stop:3382 length:720 start_codon:yes stop_codon:yes gene_type:complete